jgi:PKD repeat protein
VNVTGEESSASFEYQWDFDDQSQTVNKQRPTHVYNTPGTYEPKVKVIRQSDGAAVTAQTVPRSITVLDEEDYQLEIRTIGFQSDKIPPARKSALSAMRCRRIQTLHTHGGSMESKYKPRRKY